MIDVENRIFTDLYNVIKAAYPAAVVTTQAEDIQASFPAVHIEVADSYPSSSFVNSSRRENFRNLQVDIEVYTSLVSGRKAQAKTIAALIDDEMRLMGFVGRAMNPLDLSNNNTLVTRLLLRYNGTAGTDGVIYAGR